MTSYRIFLYISVKIINLLYFYNPIYFALAKIDIEIYIASLYPLTQYKELHCHFKL